MADHYYPLINKVINSLNLRERLRGFSLPFTQEETFVKPFITFSREPGSGGAPIAKAVAEKLGFDFIDKQIITQIAESTKCRQAIVKAVDERSRTKIEDIIHASLNQEYLDDVKYLRELVTLILVYAHLGHVVLLGRGANFVTPAAKGLHVRVTAPLDVRIQRAMDFEGISKEQARLTIKKVSDERGKFVKQYFEKDIADAKNYDIVLNTAMLNVDQACNIIVEAFYQKFSWLERYTSLL